MRKHLPLLCTAAICCAGFSSTLHATDRGDYVYVESNLSAPNANSVYAFSRAPNGDLRPVPGSPFLTGGSGVQYAGFNLGPLDSDQEIITNPQHTLLFAVNAGTDSIAVFHIEDDGSLKPVNGSPFPSGGSDPVSLALDGNILYVVNQSGDFARPSPALPNYIAMRVLGGGVLVPVSDDTNDTSRPSQATVNVAAGSSPSQIYVAPFSDRLFGADFLGGLLRQFRRDSQGELHAFVSAARLGV